LYKGIIEPIRTKTRLTLREPDYWLDYVPDYRRCQISGFSRLYLTSVSGCITATAEEVYNTIGPWFKEKIYHRELALELPALGLETARKCGWTVEIKAKVELEGR
jgi:hypothetical protein